MKKNIKKELKEFLEFKKDYRFEQKELIRDEDKIYCDGELVQSGEDIKIGETEKWINVGFKLKGSFSQMLSNLFPYEFKFKGKNLKSIEGFFQGIKFKDIRVQNYVFTYFGTQAVHLKNATAYNWKDTGIVYWQGKSIDRFSKEYDLLIDELYISALQNPLYRQVLLNCDRPIIHAMGETDKKNTTFSRYEFEYELNCLKEFVQLK